MVCWQMCESILLVGSYGYVNVLPPPAPGTGTSAMASSMTVAWLTPLMRADGDKSTLCAMTGMQIAFTSSGMTYSRPCNIAYAFAPFIRFMLARGDTPRVASGWLRVALAVSTMYRFMSESMYMESVYCCRLSISCGVQA